MKPEAQQITIAKASGWTKMDWNNPVQYGAPTHGFKTWKPEPRQVHSIMYPPSVTTGGCGEPIPDYLNDLNACAEMEGKVIMADSALAEEYGNQLGKTYHPRWFVEVTGSHLTAMCHATAPQRCEAFLRTLNLWTT